MGQSHLLPIKDRSILSKQLTGKTHFLDETADLHPMVKNLLSSGLTPQHCSVVISWIGYGSGDSANAVPHYQKLRVRVTHIWGNRRGQPSLSAMEGPHPRGTAFVITVNLHAR